MNWKSRSITASASRSDTEPNGRDRLSAVARAGGNKRPGNVADHGKQIGGKPGFTGRLDSAHPVFQDIRPEKTVPARETGKYSKRKVPAETVPAHKRPETNERMHGTDRREAPTPEISRPASPSLPPAAWTGAGPPTDRRPAGSGYATRFRFRNPRRTARRSSARRAKRYPRPKRQRTAAAYRAAKLCRRSACR